jgi:Protein of unknown function (DUF3089)
MRYARSPRRSFTERLTVVAAVAVMAVVALAATTASAGAKTIWLCQPGHKPDPCTPGLSTTVYSPTLKRLRVTHPKPQAKPAFDCFYVYPTVSDQTTTLSNRRIDPEQRSIVLFQAARYSQYCRVYAPMYRQVTLTALDSGNTESPAQLKTPVNDVAAAFEQYLRADNHGRPFVLIGHSQGSFVLEQMIRRLIDPNRALRARMLSAILLGGDVLVKNGSDVGGTFRHVPACHGSTPTSCVVAFSTFDQTVPSNSLFGRTTVAGEHVLCVNPTSVLGSAQPDPILPSAPFAPGTLIAAGIKLLGLTQPQTATVWSSLPNSYSARCSSAGGAHVLQVTALPGAQTPTPSPDPTWGLHLLDANVELGNVVKLVHAQSCLYELGHPSPNPSVLRAACSGVGHWTAA